MSAPSINYSDAIQVFLGAQEKDTYISHSMTPTKDKKDSASDKEITALAQIAIHGLKQQIQKNPLSCENLQAQAQAVRDYLVKVKDASEAADITRIYLDLFNEVEAELKELAAIDDSIYQQELKIYLDTDLNEIFTDLIEIIDKPKVGEVVQIDFQKLGIRSQKTKIRLAKLASQINPSITSNYIKIFCIKDQNAQSDIAKLVFEKAPFACRYIQNFGITDQNLLIEIAKSVRSSAISENILKFGIKDQRALIEIARLAARDHGYIISEHIQNYGLKDQDVLILLLKKM